MLVARIKYPQPSRPSPERWQQILDRSEYLIRRMRRAKVQNGK